MILGMIFFGSLFWRGWKGIVKILFPQDIWLIWLNINKFLFQIEKAKNNIHSHFIKKGAEFYAIVASSFNKPPRTQVQVKWNNLIQ